MPGLRVGLRVGLTGGLACGKSFVGRTLESLGAHLIRADELGHQTLAPGGEAYQPVIDEFGPQILDPAGLIDRHAVASLVFDNPDRLAKLNALVHPAVYRLGESLIQQIRAADPGAMIVYEAAILIETGGHKNCDRLIVVVCTEEQQIERAMARDGATREDVEARLRRQMPVAEKRKYADFIVNTSGSKEDTVRQTRDVYDALRALLSSTHAEDLAR